MQSQTGQCVQGSWTSRGWLWGLTLGFWRPLDREGLLGTRLEVYVVLWAKLMKHLFWAGHTGAARSE